MDEEGIWERKHRAGSLQELLPGGPTEPDATCLEDSPFPSFSRKMSVLFRASLAGDDCPLRGRRRGRGVRAITIGVAVATLAGLATWIAAMFRVSRSHRAY